MRADRRWRRNGNSPCWRCASIVQRDPITPLQVAHLPGALFVSGQEDRLEGVVALIIASTLGRRLSRAARPDQPFRHWI